MPANNKTVNAAVKPNDAAAGTNITYSVTKDSSNKDILKLYRNPTKEVNNLNLTYSDLQDVSTVNSSVDLISGGTVGDATFNPSTKTATLIKSKDQRTNNTTNDSCHQVAAYVAFKAEISVPALTEYKVEFSYEIKVTRNISNVGATCGITAELFYFGNTATDTNAKDQSSAITTFGYNDTSAMGNNRIASPEGYCYVHQYYWDDDNGSSTSSTFTTTDKTVANTGRKVQAIPQITMTNTDPLSAKTYTAYFGFFANSCSGTPNYNCYTDTVTMSEKITVNTVLTSPSVDNTAALYDASGNTFNFTYDQDRIELDKVDFKTLGATTSAPGSATIDGTGSCTLTDAGEYVFTFKMEQLNERSGAEDCQGNDKSENGNAAYDIKHSSNLRLFGQYVCGNVRQHCYDALVRRGRNKLERHGVRSYESGQLQRKIHFES